MDSVFWVGITADLENHRDGCSFRLSSVIRSALHPPSRKIIKTKINFSNVHREFDEVQIFHPKKDQEVLGSKCNLHYGLSEGFRSWGLSLKEMF